MRSTILNSSEQADRRLDKQAAAKRPSKSGAIIVIISQAALILIWQGPDAQRSEQTSPQGELSKVRICLILQPK